MGELGIWKDQTDDLEFTCEILIPDKKLLPAEIDNSDTTALALVTARELHHEDIVEIKFDKSIRDADKWDYIVAATSGVLTAVLDVLWGTKLSLTEAQTWGRKETDAFVMKVARAVGYKGNDFTGAIKKLEELFPIPADKLTPEFGGGLQHHLRDFAHHPTLAGLVFSILTQFTGMGYGTDTDGVFQCYKVPDTDLIGANFEEKIFNGIVMWALHLISDMAGSSSNPGKGTGIPGMLLSLMKELSVLPFFKNISVDYKDDEISFSKLISKMFKGADKPMVRLYKSTLETLGFDVWLDEDAMPAGTALHRGILQGFKDSCAAIFFITPNYKDEGFLETEINYAITEKMAKGNKFAIITLVFEKDGKCGEVPDLLKTYVWKQPDNDLVALQEIIKALPLKLGRVNYK